eukprot:5702668-Prymnesium_polylepis.1
MLVGTTCQQTPPPASPRVRRTRAAPPRSTWPGRAAAHPHDHTPSQLALPGPAQAAAHPHDHTSPRKAERPHRARSPLCARSTRRARSTGGGCECRPAES